MHSSSTTFSRISQQKECPKCGDKKNETEECLTCLYSHETSISREEAREFTLGG